MKKNNQVVFLDYIVKKTAHIHVCAFPQLLGRIKRIKK